MYGTALRARKEGKMVYLVVPEKSMWLLYEAEDIGCIGEIPDIKKMAANGKPFLVVPLEDTGETPVIIPGKPSSEQYKRECEGVVRALNEHKIFGRPFTVNQIVILQIFLGIEHDAEEDEEE